MKPKKQSTIHACLELAIYLGKEREKFDSGRRCATVAQMQQKFLDLLGEQVPDFEQSKDYFS